MFWQRKIETNTWCHPKSRTVHLYCAPAARGPPERISLKFDNHWFSTINKEIFMKKAFLCALAVLLIVALFHLPTPAQTGCKGMMEWSELVTPSPPYNACASEMKTTFAYEVIWSTGGYSGVHCIVINSGWDEYYSPYGLLPGRGQKISTWHCTNLKNHQLQMDVTVDLELGWKFDPYYLKAEYFEDNPASPEP